MPNIFEFEGYKPVIQESTFIHPTASIIGNVIIGNNCYIGSGASIRGDFGRIIIEDGCNIQESCTVHMFPGVTVILHENSHIGHGAIVHGAEIGRNSLVGMNSVIMDEAKVGEESIIGACSFVPTGMIIPARKIAVGNPAKIIKDVTDEMLAWKTKGTGLYHELTTKCHQSFKPCEPLTELPFDYALKEGDYKVWGKTK